MGSGRVVLPAVVFGCLWIVSSPMEIGFTLPPLGEALKKDFSKTSTRIFLDLFKQSSAFNEQRYAWDDANLVIARFDTATGKQTSVWKHYGIPSDAVSWRDDGYPAILKRWAQENSEWRTSTVAHIGKDGPHVTSGMYLCQWRGIGTLEFEKDAVAVQRDEQLKRIVLNITALNGVRIRLTDTDNSNPLHNITILPLDLKNAAGPFHPNLIQQLTEATVLRFSGWSKVDSNDYNSENNPRSWNSRTTPNHQTQNRAGGVAVEYMVALSNRLHASPWFGLPKAINSQDEYIADMATLVRDSLDPSLKIYLEYREGGPGALSNEQVQQSLLIWSIWQQVFETSWQTRLVRVAWTAAGWSLSRWSGDIVSVDAFAVAATFGELCPNAGPCAGITNFISRDAGFAHENATVEHVLDLLRSSVLMAEQKWTALRGIAHNAGQGKPLFAFTSGMDAHTADYGWRTTWDALFEPPGCQSCLYARLKIKFGLETLARMVRGDGWLVQEAWSCREQGVQYASIVGAAAAEPGKMQVGSVSECKQKCSAAASCAGFSYSAPEGVCRFVASVTDQASGENDDVLGFRTKPEACYSRTALRPAMSAEAAWTECQGRCQQVYTVNLLQAADLDALHEMEPAVRRGAELENALDEKLIAAGAHPRMKGIMMDALERWKRVAGPESVLVLPELSHQPTRWSFGGKWTDGVSHGDFALTQSPDQSPAPKMEAVTAWLQGDPLELPLTASASEAIVPCAAGCVWGICRQGTCECFPGYSGAGCDAVSSERPANECQGHSGATVGMNIGGMSYWGTEWTHVDIFKRSGDGDALCNGWTPQRFSDYEWDTQEPLNLTADGYPALLSPNQKAGRMMLRDLRRHGLSGVYTVLFDGDGVLDASMSDVKRVWRPEPGRLDVEVQLSLERNNGLWLTVERTNPRDPVRNIRVVAPGFFRDLQFRSNPFHPAFVHSLKRYRVLRFMDWALTNHEFDGSWDARATRSDLSYVIRGVPLEEMVLLANMVGADGWFCIPHRADANYVAKLAELVHSTLRPDRKIYVEFSNEVWHTGFPGGVFSEQEASKLGISRLCYAVQRTQNISRIMKGVIGSNWRERLVVVVATQASNSDATRQILACDAPAKIRGDIDAVALAPYFDGFDASVTDVAEMLVRYRRAMRESVQLVGEHAAMTRRANMSLLAYEAGPGAPVGTFNDVGIGAHQAPEMAGLVQEYYQGLQRAGVDVIMHFSSAGLPSKYGAWGLIEGTDQNPSDAPKQVGLFAFLDSTAQCAFPNATGCTHAAQCSGQGFCVDGGCSCFYGFSGADCSKAQYTEHVECGYKCTFDQGVCRPHRTEGLERYWQCQCGNGYWGSTCSRFECPDQCNHAGMCIDQGICSCFPGYSGERCEHDCGCGGHGECDAEGTCACDAGWRRSASGETCAWDCSCNGDQSGCIGPGICGCKACEKGSCVGGRCQCWAGFTGSDCSQPIGKPNDGSPIGMNIAGVGYGLNRVFVDAMKHSSEWVSVPAVDTGNTSKEQYIWGDGQTIHQGADGYLLRLDSPTQEVVALSLRDVCTHTAAGRFVALYDGDGFLDFGMDATVVSFAKGRVEIDFSSSCDPSCWFDKAGWKAYCTDNGMYIRVRYTNPANPLRNIRIIMPGFEHRYQTMPFHPLFIQSLQHFSSLRFMDWQHTNAQTDVAWSDRKQIRDRTYVDGVPIELMITLANTVGADPWFCMPHTANDDYVRSFARLALNTLRDDLRVYVEHSNEVWNFAFPQGEFAQAEGERLGLADDLFASDAECWSFATRCPEYRYRYHARRSKQIFAIWEEVWGTRSRDRLSFVLSTWSYSAAATREIMQFDGAGAAADLVGVTAYMGVDYHLTSTVATKSVDDILQDMRRDIPNLIASLQRQQAVALEYGKQLITYEGGPGLVEDGVIFGRNGGFGPLTEKLIAVARSDQMEWVYREALDALVKAGVFDRARPFMAFASVGPFSKYGAWGHQEYSGQPLSQTPKLRALLWAVSNSTSTSRSTPPLSCADPANGGWGLALGMRYGPSGVMSPAAGDEWVWGREYDVWWNTDEGQGRKVSISLWRSGTCPGRGVRVLVVSRSVPDTGRRRYKVPDWLEARNDYMVVVETARGVFISEPFGISGGARFGLGEWGTCSQSCGSGVQTREVRCETVASRELAKYRGDMEVDAASFDCLEEDQKLDEGQWAWNQWLGRWQLDWVGNTLASHWAVQPSWHVITCSLAPSGCRDYRTARRDSEDAQFPPPYLHGNFKNVLDCTALRSPDPRGIDSGARTPAEGSCSLTGIRPASWQLCFERPCGDAGWVAGDWSTCSAQCGGGEQRRSLKCLDRSGAEVAGRQCQAAGLQTPATQRRCNMASCPTFQWVVSGEWEACSASCGTGIRVRTVLCVARPSGAVASPRSCPASSKPASLQRCNTNPCNTSHWRADDWSWCSERCGDGLRHRNVSCVLGSTEIVSDQQCTTTPKPTMSEACTLGSCEKMSWRVGDWSQCSAACGEGSMERQVVCWSSVLGAVDSARCQNLGLPPAAVQGCIDGSCEPCGGTPACSGHGSCRNQTCLCSAGFHGSECALPPSCPTGAVLDALGACCASGVRDAEGTCCTSGVLDGCGDCDGSSAQIDATNVCCQAGILDAGGLCCPEGNLDRCGVCNGRGVTCGTRIRMVLGGLLDGGLEESDLESNLTVSMQSALQAWLQDTGASVTVKSVAADSESAVRRAGGGAVSVDATVEGGGSLLLLTLEEGAVDMGGGSSVLSMEAQAVGVCGNGVCESGERCDEGAEDCCGSDCAYSMQSCGSAVIDTTCSGHGVCLAGQGACDCFQGYGGEVCETQVSSTDYSARPSVRFASDAVIAVGNTVLSVALVRGSGTQYAVKVNFSTTDVTATAGQDYVVAQDRTVVIPGGRSSGSIDLVILQGHGTFQIAISTVEVECEVGAGAFNCQGEVGSPSVIVANISRTVAGPVCGNGVRQEPETCDDGNGEDWDGCSGTCAVELGYSCAVSPGVLGDLCEIATAPGPGQAFVRASTRLTGVTAAEFVSAVRLAFRKAVASALSLVTAQVVIDAVSERRAQGSVQVDYHAIVVDAEADALAARLEAIHSDGSLENALRLQGINTSVVLLSAPTVARAEPTATPVVPLETGSDGPGSWVIVLVACLGGLVVLCACAVVLFRCSNRASSGGKRRSSQVAAYPVDSEALVPAASAFAAEPVVDPTDPGQPVKSRMEA